MALELRPRFPVVSKWGSVRFDALENGRVVGTIWDWRPGRHGDRLWAADATDQYGHRLAASSGTTMTSELEARAWLAGWWMRRRGDVPVERGPGGGGAPSAQAERGAGGADDVILHVPVPGPSLFRP